MGHIAIPLEIHIKGYEFSNLLLEDDFSTSKVRAESLLSLFLHQSNYNSRKKKNRIGILLDFSIQHISKSTFIHQD